MFNKMKAGILKADMFSSSGRSSSAALLDRNDEHVNAVREEKKKKLYTYLSIIGIGLLLLAAFSSLIYLTPYLVNWGMSESLSSLFKMLSGFGIVPTIVALGYSIVKTIGLRHASNFESRLIRSSNRNTLKELENKEMKDKIQSRKEVLELFREEISSTISEEMMKNKEFAKLSFSEQEKKTIRDTIATNYLSYIKDADVQKITDGTMTFKDVIDDMLKNKNAAVGAGGIKIPNISDILKEIASAKESGIGPEALKNIYATQFSESLKKTKVPVAEPGTGMGATHFNPGTGIITEAPASSFSDGFGPKNHPSHVMPASLPVGTYINPKPEDRSKEITLQPKKVTVPNIYDNIYNQEPMEFMNEREGQEGRPLNLNDGTVRSNVAVDGMKS